MAEDKASEKYMPDEEDTKTVKTLINQILGATLACYSHCQAYEVVWEAGYDTLADTYKPKDSYRIYVGGSRLAAFRRALDLTGNVARVQADGKWHIFKPTISGVVYDSQYSLESGHTFFSKAYRNTLVIPNRIVVKSQPDDDPQYSGSAQIDGYADLPEAVKKTDYKQMRLESNSQADDIAAAILSKHQLWSEMGAADVPMNVGAEVFDYVKVGAFSAKDVFRVGNLGHLTRHYNAKKAEWRMAFSFGGWLTARKVLEGLGITADELEAYFSRLMVKDLYVENILAENMNFVWIDPDNTIDLSKIGDNLDNLPDGEVYARVKTLHLDAGEIKLDEHILYKAGYNPTEKMPGDADLDNIPDGAIYQRAKSAALTAGGLVILDQVVVGTYGLVKSTDISAGHIILEECEGDIDDIDEGSIYGKVRKTDISAGHIKLTVDQNLDDQGIDIVSNTGTYKIKIDSNYIAGYRGSTKTFYLRASDGRAYCGGGAVILDDDGIRVVGTTAMLKVRYSSGTPLGSIYAAFSDDFRLESTKRLTLLADQVMRLYANDGIEVKDEMECDIIKPSGHETKECGYSNRAWRQGYFRDLFSGDGAVHEYQAQDDIALLKAIKGKVKDGKRIIDSETLPQDIVVKNKKGQNYVNVAGLAGLNIGVQKALLARIEALEAKNTKSY
ncbi:hypothetical protein ES703_77625 [subsurface metagenome]